MAARKFVVANQQYSARELRRPLQDHPALVDCLAGPGRDAVALNPCQPIAAPENLDANLLAFDVAAPIELSEKDGRYRLPLFGDRLRAALALAVRRLQNDVHRCANNRTEATDWLNKYGVLSNLRLNRASRRAYAGILVGVNDFEKQCLARLETRFTFLGRNRSYLLDERIRPHIFEQRRICLMLNRQYAYFRDVYGRFADIANTNLRGGDESGHKVTLQRLQETLGGLPLKVSVDELLDASYHGLINSALTYLNHWVMADLLDLTAALGCREYGGYNPSAAQERTFQFVIGAMPDASPHSVILAEARRKLADRMVARFGLQ